MEEKGEGRKASGVLKGKALTLTSEDLNHMPTSVLSPTSVFSLLSLVSLPCTLIILSVMCGRYHHRQSEGR